MSFLVHPLPPIPVYVKKEYLYDLEKGHGELTPGIWISVKSVKYKALYLETLLTDYGALFDKLPISAFVWTKNYDKDNQLPLDILQLWDCFDYDITVLQKPLLSRCEFFGKDKKMHPGEYKFTIDNAHRDTSIIDTNFSEHDPEHKSFNVIKLDNGQFAAQPNNRIVWRDSSLTPENLLQPDFKVCTQNYCVETEPKWSVGHTDEWQYKSKEEETLDK
tara:strand:- start:720 stop:1373 length:654 start_codon:yes stop_codon:yes gene_type:complete